MTGPEPSRFTTLDERVADLAKDALYVTVGFGVLAVQRLQVHRRELRAAVEQRLGTTGDAERSAGGPCQLAERVDAVEARLDEIVERLQDRLPGSAGQLVGQAHEAARSTRGQLRDLTRRIT